MTGFALDAPARTIFGRGCRTGAAAEIAAMGQRVLVIRGRSVPWVEDLLGDLKRAGTEPLTFIAQGEPDLQAVRDGVAAARTHRADCIAGVGGGSAIDLGKAVAGLCPSAGDPSEYLELGPARPRRLSEPLPLVAIPTTAGTGAEATRNAVLGVPERRAKISLRDSRLMPDLVIIDPALTDGTPLPLTLASGLDAITQLIESYLSCRANPVTDALCRGALEPAVSALHRLMVTGEAPEARDTMARSSYLSGLALANSGLGVVHGLASVIGGRGGAHGAICGRLLPAGLTVNRMAVARAGGDESRFAEIDALLRDRLGGRSGPESLRAFIDAHDLPGLAALGVTPDQIDEIAAQAATASSTRANPVPLAPPEIAEILRGALVPAVDRGLSSAKITQVSP